MITIVCRACSTAVRVTGEPSEVEHLFGELNPEWYPDKFPCPGYGCDSTAEAVDAIDPAALQALSVHDLSPHEAYAAFNGLGIPKERDCGPTAVKTLLMNQRIVGGDVQLIRGSNRSVIHNLEFDDGTVLYLASSTYGATVYRIAKPESAVERVG